MIHETNEDITIDVLTYLMECHSMTIDILKTLAIAYYDLPEYEEYKNLVAAANIFLNHIIDFKSKIRIQ